MPQSLASARAAWKTQRRCWLRRLSRLRKQKLSARCRGPDPIHGCATRVTTNDDRLLLRAQISAPLPRPGFSAATHHTPTLCNNCRVCENRQPLVSKALGETTTTSSIARMCGATATTRAPVLFRCVDRAVAATQTPPTSVSRVRGPGRRTPFAPQFFPLT